MDIIKLAIILSTLSTKQIEIIRKMVKDLNVRNQKSKPKSEK